MIKLIDKIPQSVLLFTECSVLIYDEIFSYDSAIKVVIIYMIYNMIFTNILDASFTVLNKFIRFCIVFGVVVFSIPCKYRYIFGNMINRKISVGRIFIQLFGNFLKND